MIGVDTNVLVRYLTQDDAAQARAVDAFLTTLEDGERLRIDDIVLCELVWVLRAAYRLNKSTIVDAVDKVLNTARFSFEDRDLLRKALDDFRDGKGDFADYLIGWRNLRAGCHRTTTFDLSLEGSTSFVLL